MRIGASETITQSWLPLFLKAISEKYPRVNVDLTVDISLNIRAALVERRIDLVFLIGPISELSVENAPLPAFDLYWYRATNNPQTDLTQIPVISYSSQTRPYRELMSELSQNYGPRVRVFASASLSASLKMIAEGIAVGPYPYALVSALLDAGQIKEFDPGIYPQPLQFTASYISEPRSFLVESTVKIASEVATAWDETVERKSK